MSLTRPDSSPSSRSLIVVGSGLAGLTAALRADARGFGVTLVTKGALDDSNSRYAQGGIAAAVFDDDTVDLHVADTMAAGAGLSVLAAVEALCTDGPDRIEDLVGWGVEFDGDSSGWSRGLEAAHSRSRVLHAGGDATGAAIVAALIARLRSSGVTVVENAFLADLIVADASRSASERRVVGVELVLDDGVRARLEADDVVLATGGAGQLFEFTTNPAGATGDGLAAAWRAGARVDDLEFFQFHPTALAIPGSFLISEAVRGEGAVLIDESGHRFMTDIDPRGELAPRDIVARGIAAAMAKQGGRPVLLDATGLGAELLQRRFPTITAATRAAGVDWTREPIPVTPAAHYFMGGVSTDLWGRTSLAGLYAVGEVASTGVHGANRLASNSLLEAAVFGWRAVEAIVGAEASAEGTFEGAADDVAAPEGVAAALPEVVETSSGVALTRIELQRLLWNAAGVARSGTLLREASVLLARAAPAEQASCLSDTRASATAMATVGATAPTAGSAAPDVAPPWQAVSAAAQGPARVVAPAAAAAAQGPARVVAPAAAPAAQAPAATRAALETANLLDVARLVVAGALAREESRGAHYRSDFPTPSDAFAHSISWAREVSQHAHR
jgi:L-aspartate oxidase